MCDVYATQTHTLSLSHTHTHVPTRTRANQYPTAPQDVLLLLAPYSCVCLSLSLCLCLCLRLSVNVPQHICCSSSILTCHVPNLFTPHLSPVFRCPSTSLNPASRPPLTLRVTSHTSSLVALCFVSLPFAPVGGASHGHAVRALCHSPARVCLGLVLGASGTLQGDFSGARVSSCVGCIGFSCVASIPGSMEREEQQHLDNACESLTHGQALSGRLTETQCGMERHGERAHTNARTHRPENA